MATKFNPLGIALVTFFLLGGLALLLGPVLGLSLGNRFSGVLWLVIAGAAIWRWRRGSTEAGRRERLVKAGARGVATVLSASERDADRGLPTLSLRLELDVPGIEPRQVDHEEEVAVYAAHGIKPGLRLPVVVDPRDPARIVLVW